MYIYDLLILTKYDCTYHIQQLELTLNKLKKAGLNAVLNFFSVGHNYINFFCGQLHSKESRECNWVFNIGEVFKTDIFMSVIK